MSSGCYGFNLTTLTCATMQLDQWTAIFGPEDGSSKDSIEEAEKEESMMWFAQCRPKVRRQTEQPEHTCDPDVCRMSSGICVDCTRCSRHCKCQSSQETKVETRPRTVAEHMQMQENVPQFCHPSTCKQLICGDCSRCTKHCSCNWENERAPLRCRSVSHVEDAFLQGLNRQRTWTEMRQKQKASDIVSLPQYY